MVDGIVVDQSRKVDEFQNGSESHGIRIGRVADLIGQKDKRRAKELPGKEKEVVVNLLDQVEIPDHDSPDFSENQVQSATNRSLDLSEAWESLAGSRTGFGHLAGLSNGLP